MMQSCSDRVARLAGSPAARTLSGTAAPLRRDLAKGLASNVSDALVASYVHAYRLALSEGLLLFIHLSKSGGTALCELAKLNGCSRASAGMSTFTGNCANRQAHDGPWWLPAHVIAKLQPPGLRQFAERSFLVPHRLRQRDRNCRTRGKRAPPAATAPLSRTAQRLQLTAPPTFFAIEGALPEPGRCAGMLELLVLREPLRRLASFGRELMRWGLLPQPHAFCEHQLISPAGALRRRRCDEVKRRVCANFSLMSAVAPPVYDNQLTRALLGHEIYRLPAGRITRDHYLIARERLRSVDVLLRLDGNLVAALGRRLGWQMARLQSMYKRQSVGIGAEVEVVISGRGRARRGFSGSSGSSDATASPAPPPLCALNGPMADHARNANRWDVALYEEALQLEALDRSFFDHRAALLALGGSPANIGDAANPPPSRTAAVPEGVGSAAGCGYLSEPRLIALRRSRVVADPDAAADGSASELGPQPICIHKRWRHLCCWESGAGGPPISMPRLPMPDGCVLPPAGALSAAPTVRTPLVPQKHHHSSCALSCAGYPHFGLEAAGLFCMCLTRDEATRAMPITERECTPSCASSGRLHGHLAGQRAALPCGGSEAVALFATKPVLGHLIAATFAHTLSAPRARNLGARSGGNVSVYTERCAPMAEACDSAELKSAYRRRGVRVLYVRSSHPRTPTKARAESDRSVLLGCFDAAALEKKGLSARPGVHEIGAAEVTVDPKAAHGGDMMRWCSRGCARYAYFAVGPAQLVGGPCVCGKLRMLEWRRDEEGLRGLQRKGLQSYT